jgi:hypothetical protein
LKKDVAGSIPAAHPQLAACPSARLQKKVMDAPDFPLVRR